MIERFRFFCRDQDGNLISKFDRSPWNVGEWRETSGTGPLCGPGWLHCYDTPELAEFHDPIHGEYGPNAELWRVECGGVGLHDGALKCGWTRLRPVERIERVIPTPDQQVRYAILVTMTVLPDEPWVPDWRHWADDWLSGRDRSAKSASRAVSRTMAWASQAALAATAAAVAADVRTTAAVWAAETAARATEAAAGRGDIDLAAIARQAMAA